MTDVIEAARNKALADALRGKNQAPPEPRLYPGYSAFVIVDDPADHHNHRVNIVGWDMLALISDEAIERGGKYDPQTGQHRTQYDNEPAHDPFLVKKTRYLFGEPTDTTVLRLRDEIGDANNATYAANDATRLEKKGREQAETLLKEMTGFRDAGNKEVKSLRQQRDALTSDSNQFVDERKKLVRDMNKLRKHFGDAAVDVVLAPKAKA